MTLNILRILIFQRFSLQLVPYTRGEILNNSYRLWFMGNINLCFYLETNRLNLTKVFNVTRHLIRCLDTKTDMTRLPDHRSKEKNRGDETIVGFFFWIGRDVCVNQRERLDSENFNRWFLTREDRKTGWHQTCI